MHSDSEVTDPYESDPYEFDSDNSQVRKENTWSSLSLLYFLFFLNAMCCKSKSAQNPTITLGKPKYVAVGFSPSLKWTKELIGFFSNLLPIIVYIE
jgi:hypothetical protein